MDKYNLDAINALPASKIEFACQMLIAFAEVDYNQAASFVTHPIEDDGPAIDFDGNPIGQSVATDDTVTINLNPEEAAWLLGLMKTFIGGRDKAGEYAWGVMQELTDAGVTMGEG